MQNAESVRKAICAMGRKGVPLERVYRLLYNPDLYLTAYGRLYRNKGATTPGATGETVEGMSLDKIKAIIELLRYERYRWSPARRVYIPKANGKKRPLGLPIWVSYCLSFQALFGIPRAPMGWISHANPPAACYSTMSCCCFPERRRFQYRWVGLRSAAMMSGVRVIQRGPCE
jgi:hypothetical protein